MRESSALLSLVLIGLFGISLLFLLKPDPRLTGSNPAAIESSRVSEPKVGLYAPLDRRVNEDRRSSFEETAVEESRREPLREQGCRIVGRVRRPSGTVSGLTLEVHENLRGGIDRTVASALSDVDGRFHLAGLEAGRYRMSIKGESIPPGLLYAWFELKADQEFDLGALYVPNPSALHGRVVDAQGVPLAAMRVFRKHVPRHGPARFNRVIDVDDADADPNVLTDGEGRFAFAGLLTGKHKLLVESFEYADREIRTEVEEGQILDLGDIRVSRGHSLRGRVIGLDGVPIVDALVAPGKHLGSHFFRRGVQTDIDGNFSLRGLAWPVDSIRASTEGYVDVTERWSRFDSKPLILLMQLDLPQTGRTKEEVDLETAMRLLTGMNPASRQADSNRSKQVEVWVRDEQGEPITDAEVNAAHDSYYKIAHPTWPDHRAQIRSFLNAGRGEGAKLATDEHGHATLTSEPGKSFGVAAAKAGYLPAGASFHAGQIPDSIDLVMSRAASIEGIIDEVGGKDRFSMGVELKPVAGQGPRLKVNSSWRHHPVDAQGRFVIDRLLPGRYQLAIWRRDATEEKDPALRQRNVTPLLDSGVDSRNRAIVDLQAGQRARVKLEVAPLGSIRGRVLLRGEPLADVIIFAAAPEKEIDQDSIDAPKRQPAMTTREDGRFEFLYANPGSWRLVARHKDAPVTSVPIEVVATSHALEIELDIELEAAEIRGQLDVQSIPPSKRRVLSAYLFNRSRAETDPFYWPHYGSQQTDGMKEVDVSKDGKFSFPYLPAGDWVLRIVSPFSDLLYQLPIHTERGQVIDLGPFALAVTVDLDMELALPNEGEFHGLWIHRLYEDSGDPVFARSVMIIERHAKLAGMIPGRYRAELMESDAFTGAAGSIGLSGKHSKKFATFEVHADGTTTPEKLVF